MKIRDLQYLTATNSVFEVERKHYITIFIGSVCEEGAEPKVSLTSFWAFFFFPSHVFRLFPVLQGHWLTKSQIMEPEKCEAWEWVSWDELLQFGKAGTKFEGRDLFLPISNLFEQRPDFRV